MRIFLEGFERMEKYAIKAKKASTIREINIFYHLRDARSV
jgi:hypothetical protein